MFSHIVFCGADRASQWANGTMSVGVAWIKIVYNIKRKAEQLIETWLICIALGSGMGQQRLSRIGTHGSCASYRIHICTYVFGSKVRWKAFISISKHGPLLNVININVIASCHEESCVLSGPVYCNAIHRAFLAIWYHIYVGAIYLTHGANHHVTIKVMKWLFVGRSRLAANSEFRRICICFKMNTHQSTARLRSTCNEYRSTIDLVETEILGSPTGVVEFWCNSSSCVYKNARTGAIVPTPVNIG